ncbi:hypothetical protein NBRC116494_33590 [Aurantivibrio plasticivorans]
MASKSTIDLFYVFLYGLAFLLLSLTVVWYLAREDTDESLMLETSATESKTETIESVWQWSSNEALREYAATQQGGAQGLDARVAATIDEQRIVKALGDVRIDHYGNVVVDEVGLQALYQTIGYSAVTMSQQQRDYVSQVIRDGLPSPAAEQVVDIVGNFFEYLQAKSQLETVYPNVTDPVTLSIKLDDLQTLRQMYFGGSVAEKLFKRQHVQEQYMLENLRITSDTSVSEDEKQRQREQAQKHFLTRDYGITNWLSRRDIFLQQKADILNSSLSSAEQAQQIEWLFDASFSVEEQQAIAAENLTEF